MSKEIKNAILYTRVSTAEQEDGASLRYQEEQLRNFCKNKNWTVVGLFTDKESGRDYDRKEFINLQAYIKSNKGKVDYILVTRWDRFGRNQFLTVKAKSDLKKMGVTVMAIEQNIDETIPEHKLIENIQYTLDEIESDKISLRVKASNYKFAKEGAFLNRAPKGYDKTRIDGKSSLKKNELSEIIRESFVRFSGGNYSTEALRKELNLNVCKQTFINILRDKIYAGYIKVPAFKGEDSYWTRGLHEPIIDIVLYEKVQNVLNGNRPVPIRVAKRENDFFLRGHVICPICHHPFTASRSKGRVGYYSYYHCDSKYGCKQRFTKAEFEGKLIQSISSLKVKESIEKIYSNILKTVVGDNTKYKTRRSNEIERELKELNEKIYKNQDLLVDGKITDVIFNSINNRYTLEKKQLETELAQVKVKANNETYSAFSNGVSVVKGIERIMSMASPTDKSLVIGSIFPEKLSFGNGEYRTTNMNSFVSLLCPNIKGFGGLENKKAIISDGLSTSAHEDRLFSKTLQDGLASILTLYPLLLKYNIKS